MMDPAQPSEHVRRKSGSAAMLMLGQGLRTIEDDANNDADEGSLHYLPPQRGNDCKGVGAFRKSEFMRKPARPAKLPGQILLLPSANRGRVLKSNSLT